MSRPPARPLVLAAGAHQIAAVLHEPAPATRRDGALLLCPPWGWEEVASARTRMLWACELAAAGITVLRIDLPGCGDSSGSPRDPGLADAWIDAIAAATSWLRDIGGIRTVAIAGLGLSGLLARAAVHRGAPADGLLLWQVPADGRAAVRRIRAFARLSGPAGADEATDGIDAGGFLLTDDTAAALAALHPADQGAGRLVRALVLDDPGPLGGPAAGLADAGVVVDVRPAAGWEAMTDHPETSVLPAAAVAIAGRWLRDITLPTAVPSVAPAGTLMTLRDGAAHERAVRIPVCGGTLAGVLTSPAGRAGDTCVVFLSAGAVRRIGPNRLWVQAARALAAAGVASVRIDLGGVGDSTGIRPEGPWTTAEFYENDTDAQIHAVLTWLEQHGAGSRFILTGLCSGGYWALRTATDPRVAAVVAANAGAVVWDRRAQARDELRRLTRVSDPEWWAKLARGGVDLRGRRLRGLGTAVLRGGATPAERRHAAALAAVFDGLGAAATHAVLAFSDGEPAYNDLWRHGIIDRLSEWPEVTLHRLPGGDHTLRPMAAQSAFLELLQREIAGALALAR